MQIIVWISLWVYIIFLLLHPASEEERKLKNGEKDRVREDLNGGV